MAIGSIASPIMADPFPDAPHLPTGVTEFWCGGASTSCQITCYIGNTTKVISGVNAARVQTYPGSDKLWLETSPGPNNIYLLGGAFCDFTKMPITRPQK